jgi:hypothetical protein
MAKQINNVSSDEYEKNIQNGTGQIPKLSKRDVVLNEDLGTEFMAERLKP